jgi:hypothetical protein
MLAACCGYLQVRNTEQTFCYAPQLHTPNLLPQRLHKNDGRESSALFFKVEPVKTSEAPLALHAPKTGIERTETVMSGAS